MGQPSYVAGLDPSRASLRRPSAFTKFAGNHWRCAAVEEHRSPVWKLKGGGSARASVTCQHCWWPGSASKASRHLLHLARRRAQVIPSHKRLGARTDRRRSRLSSRVSNSPETTERSRHRLRLSARQNAIEVPPQRKRGRQRTPPSPLESEALPTTSRVDRRNGSAFLGRPWPR